MALLICAATAKELAALAPDLLPKESVIKEMQPMRAQIRHGEAIFLATGVGPINAALAMGLCFGLTHETVKSDIKIDAALYAGLAGAFDLEKTPLCSILVVKEEIWPEYGLHDGVAVTARAFKHPLWEPEVGEAIYERIDLAGVDKLPHVKKKGDPWPECKSLTVAGVSASFARRNAMWDAWHVELENMEGFAAAYAAARADVPLVEIRVVSNKVGPRSKAEKDFEGALETMAEILPDLNLL